MPGRRDTKRLRSYTEMARDIDREARAILVEVLREEETLAKVQGVGDAALIKKYNMNGGGN